VFFPCRRVQQAWWVTADARPVAKVRDLGSAAPRVSAAARTEPNTYPRAIHETRRGPLSNQWLYGAGASTRPRLGSLMTWRGLVPRPLAEMTPRRDASGPREGLTSRGHHEGPVAAALTALTGPRARSAAYWRSDCQQ
jgi:hypothetical protein